MNWLKLFQSRKDPESLLSADQRKLAAEFVVSVQEWALLHSIQLILIPEPHGKLADMINLHCSSCNHVLDQVESYPLNAQKAWHKYGTTIYLASSKTLLGGVGWRTRVDQHAREFAGRIPRDDRGSVKATFPGLEGFRGTESDAITATFGKLLPDIIVMLADDFRWRKIEVND